MDKWVLAHVAHNAHMLNEFDDDLVELEIDSSKHENDTNQDKLKLNKTRSIGT